MCLTRIRWLLFIKYRKIKIIALIDRLIKSNPTFDIALTQLFAGPVILNPVTEELSPDAPYEPAPKSLMDAIAKYVLLMSYRAQ